MREFSIVLTTQEELERLIERAVRSSLNALEYHTKPRKRLLSAKDIQAEFGICKRTLEYWRAEGAGPEYTTVGGRILYERALFEAFIAAGRVRPT